MHHQHPHHTNKAPRTAATNTTSPDTSTTSSSTSSSSSFPATRSNLVVVVVLVAALCFGVYSNSLDGRFAFDDNFAIISNGDAHWGGSWLEMWRKDFWGQDIGSDGSHKSYRPLTVLSFRLNHYLHEVWGLGAYDWARKPGASRVRPPANGMVLYYHRPLPSNATSTSTSTLTLTQAIALRPENYTQEIEALGPRGYHIGNVLLHTVVSVLLVPLGHALLQHAACPMPFETAVVASVMFAVHPIHTEAVSGLVGRAEMLCGVFYLLALIVYRNATMNSERVAMFVRLQLAMVLAIASTLSKESGFTVLGLFVVFELCVASRLKPSLRLWYVAAFVRIVITIAVAMAFLWLRRIITVSFTVEIYRRLENPIAFIDDRLLRSLSNAYVHWRYFKLLVLPLQMSADWSFNCVPMIESLQDWDRIAPAVALYTSLFVLLAVLGVKFLLSLRSTPASVAAAKRSRHVAPTANAAGVLLFLVCLTIFPFVPASNWFFPVGTLIGERLLYLPSIGLCLILAYVLSVAYHGRVTDELPPKATPATDTGASSTLERLGRFLRKALVVLVAVAIIASYANLTYQRNFHWDSEETLFLSAAQVCPESAKVQENLGILLRRYRLWNYALECFERALEIWPEYCEVDYWIGSTLFSTGKINQAVAYLTKAISCKYTAVNSVLALKQLYDNIRLLSRTEPEMWENWAVILEKHVNRTEEAALMYAEIGNVYLLRSVNLDSNLLATLVTDGDAKIVPPAADLKKSIRALKKALALWRSVGQSPGCEPQYWLGRALLLSQRPYNESLVPLRAAVLCPDTRMAALSAILELLNANTHDPWLHNVWASIMLEAGAAGEAFKHLRIAAMIYAHLLEEIKYTEAEPSIAEIESALQCLQRALELSQLLPQSAEPDIAKMMKLRDRIQAKKRQLNAMSNLPQ